MGNYVQKLEKRLRDHRREKVIATAALCGAELEQSKILSQWTYKGATWGVGERVPYRGSEGQRFFASKLKAAQHFLKVKGVQVDYGF